MIAIVLPCLVLGFLAFRGIKNDQALVERDLQNNLLESGQQIIREIDSYINSLETSFAGLADSVMVPRDIIFHNPALNRLCSQNHSVAGIYYISGRRDFFLLNNRLLYFPDELSPISDIRKSQTQGSVIEKGWQYEFRENDYTKALRYYQDILPGISDEYLTVEVLNIVARLQKKLQLNDEAGFTYDKIWKDYPDIYIQNSLPSGAVALIEKSFLYLTLRDTISALKNIRLLLSQLRDCRWEQDQSHYENFISKTDEIISLVKNSSDEGKNELLGKISALKDSLKTLEKHTEYMLSLFGNVDLISEEKGNINDKTATRRKILINGKACLISAVSVEDKGQWGLIFDQDYILRNIIPQYLSRQFNHSVIQWEIKDINGILLLNSGNIREEIAQVNIVFPAELPSWTMTFYREKTGLFLSFFRSGGGIFLYIFIAILIILAFGLFFTLYTVNNEIRLSVLKSNFMSTVSHEFKSPLAAIRQMAEMLVNGRVPTAERQQKYYNTILQQSERLSHLIDNILDFSRMEEGKKIFGFVKADIVAVVRDVVDSFKNQPMGQGFDIRLSVNEPIPEMVIDIEAIRQVMNNLIDNAIKYSGDSRKVEIDLQTIGNNVSISIRDHGIGIKKSDHDKIFNRFYRAGDELTQTVKGSGIGLTIVRQIVEAHKGTIEVDSEPGKGSKFIIILPMDEKLI